MNRRLEEKKKNAGNPKAQPIRAIKLEEEEEEKQKLNKQINELTEKQEKLKLELEKLQKK